MGQRRQNRKSLGLAKLTPPTLPMILKRPRLFRLLDKARRRPITWLTAPAGSGKTTLVASYLKARRLPVLWYRLDESDADPSSFFHYLATAAKALSPRRRMLLAALTPEYFLGLPTYARRFFAQLWDYISLPRVLVLDNYHDVPTTSPLHGLLQVGLSELPEKVWTIVLSREEPPDQMVSLKVARTLSWVKADALRLTPHETQQLAKLQRLKNGPSRNSRWVTQIHAITQGWMAGVVLFLEHARAETAAMVSSETAPSRTIFQYLAREVMARLEPGAQESLLKIGLLPETTAEMAVTLTGLPGAGDLLTRFYRIRYFTERVDRQTVWYRFHPLFRDFLLTQLLSKYEPKDVQRLRQISAGLLAEAGRQEDAITLLRDAEDWPTMNRQIIAIAPTMLGQGRVATVEGWISSIPPTAAREFTWLRFWQGCCRVFLNPSEAQHIFEEVFERFVADGDQAGILLAWTNLVRCILLQWKCLPCLDQWIDRFAALQPDGAPYPSDEIEAHVAEAMAGALVWRRPQNPQTRYWLERAIVLNDRLTGLGAGHAIFSTESYLTWLGDLAGARKGNDRLLERASKLGALPSMKMVYYMGEAMLSWIDGRAEDCRTAVRKGLSLAEREGIHLWDGWLIFQGIQNNLLNGDLETVWQQLENVQRGSLEGLYLSQYYYQVAWYSLLIGDLQSALSMSEQALETAVQDGGPFPEALCCLLAASTNHNCGNHQKAKAHRTRAETIGEAMGSDLLRYGAWLLASQFAFDSGDRVKGLESLRDAFALGRKQEMTEYPGWQAQAIARLCATALDEGIEVPYVQDLIRKRWLPLAPELRPAAWPWRVKIYTLGKFQVLVDGQPLGKNRKAPHRLLDLLLALVVCGGQDVPMSRLMDMLWPDADGDQAQENLKKSIARLRKLLGVDDAVRWQERKISLNPARCWVDAWTFEACIKQAESRSQPGKVVPDDQAERKAIELYRGLFLGREDVPEWTMPYQQELRSRFVRLVTSRLDQAQIHAHDHDVMRELETAIDIDPTAEPLYLRLIPLLLSHGRRTDAVAHYNRYRSELARWAGRTPSSEIQEIARTL